MESQQGINVRSEVVEVPKWEGYYGSTLLLPEMLKKVQFLPTAELPKDRDWSLANYDKKEELDEVSKKYKSRDIKNRKLLAVRNYKLDMLNLTTEELYKLWEEDPSGAFNFEEGLSTKISIQPEEIYYYEAVAFLRGDVEGLENPRPLLVSLIVETSDEKLIFMQRSGSSAAGEDMIGIVGGTCDVDKTPDEQAIEEAHEELGIPKDELNKSKLKLSNLVEDRMGRPTLFYKLKLDLSSEEVFSLWSQSEEAQKEHDGILFVDKELENVIDFMQKHNPDQFHPPADAFVVLALNEAMNDEAEYISRMMATSSPV